MNRFILILVLCLTVEYCQANGKSCLDSAQDTKLRPVVAKLCGATARNHKDVLLVRTEFGLIAVPDDYSVNTLWTPGLLLQIEPSELEDHGDESPFLSSIRFRSKEDLEQEYFSRLIEIEGHEITGVFKNYCSSDIKVFRGSVDSEISGRAYEFTVVDFGGFVMSALSSMEQVFVAMAWATAKLNCAN